MIRDIKPNDRIAFMDMAKKFYSSAAVAHKIDDAKLEAVFFAAIDGSPYIRAFIIEEGGRPAGFALVSYSYATEAGGPAVHLEDLYVDEKLRGKGLGGKFMEFLESEYPEAKRFRLEVTKENIRAIELYRRLGYKNLDYAQMVKDK